MKLSFGILSISSCVSGSLSAELQRNAISRGYANDKILFLSCSCWFNVMQVYWIHFNCLSSV